MVSVHNRWQFSTRDLVAASVCEFSLLKRLDNGSYIPEQRRGKIQEHTDFFTGYAEELVSEASGEKLVGYPCAEHHQVRALLDLAFCYQQLAPTHPALSPRVVLQVEQADRIIREEHHIDTVLPVFQERLKLLEDLVHRFIVKGEPFSWFSPSHLKRCGRCPECSEQVKEHRDMLLLPSLPMKVRNSMVERFHITTIEQLAALEPSSGVLPALVQKYKDLAAIELGWATPEEIAKNRVDDAALLDLYGYDQPMVEETDETAQALLEATGKDETEESDAELALNNYVAEFVEGEELSPDDMAVAMISAATSYHRKERSQFWLDHYHRLAADMDQWEGTRNVAIFDRIAVEEPWAKDPERPRAQPTRLLKASARVGEGSSLKVGDKDLFLMYRAPFPPHVAADFAKQIARFADADEFDSVRFGAFKATIETAEPAGNGLMNLTIRESLPRGGSEFEQLPMALSPARPIQTKAQEEALTELAQLVGATLPNLPELAGVDIVRRRPPRLKHGAQLPAVDADTYGSFATIEAIHRAVTLLDHSYVAVQGPPGSGKTFLGAHVIGRLIADGWKIGVVSQSHAVVENVLTGCIEKETVAPELVSKLKGKTKMVDAPWEEISEAELAKRLAGPAGLLLGGTAWDFSNEKKFPAESLDLLVIDEAGQFSLANTLAVGRAAQNMLLLGDPQQLPQVTQGSHDYPVDESALGWLTAGHETLPAHLGYFLNVSWRMHPALCAPVSALSYEGKLESAAAGSTRYLSGWEPGVYRIPVEHSGNTTSSIEEADQVVHWARQFIGAQWTPDTSHPEKQRPLDPQDILVVAAYNAQVDLISERLERAGLRQDGDGVRVGTVDKFQGQEAPVVLVSMAASSAGESVRGADFLLSPNRLNVALSRGQWCALVLESNQLTNYLPDDVEGLKQLGRFVRLASEAHDVPDLSTSR